MKSPRFLAALAMAAVLTTGVTTTAHAASANVIQSGGFTNSSGNVNNGQQSMQESEVKELKKGALNGTLESTGDVKVNGTFTKRINSFPAPDKEGHYLRVSMPIKIDYTYDVDTRTLTAPEIVISNDSVYATQPDPQGVPQKLEYKKIKMSFVDFIKNDIDGINTISPEVEFVDVVDTKVNSTNILLPFQFNVKGQTSGVDKYLIKDIKNNHQTDKIKAVEIAPSSTLTLQMAEIPGQSIGNANLLTQQTSETSHRLKLKFEYDGN